MKINIFDFDGTLTTEPVPNYWISDGDKQAAKTMRAIKEGIEQSVTHKMGCSGFLNEIRWNSGITREDMLQWCGRVKYAPGVLEFFKQSNDKNYIVSGGFTEFLNNLPIAQYFAGIYGTIPLFNSEGVCTGVTRFMADDKKVPAIREILKENGKNETDCRDTTFIGDGLSDIDVMRYVYGNGGRVIFVYQAGDDEVSLRVYGQLRDQGVCAERAAADYTSGSELYKMLQRQ